METIVGYYFEIANSLLYLPLNRDLKLQTTILGKLSLTECIPLISLGS